MTMEAGMVSRKLDVSREPVSHISLRLGDPIYKLESGLLTALHSILGSDLSARIALKILIDTGRVRRATISVAVWCEWLDEQQKEVDLSSVALQIPYLIWAMLKKPMILGASMSGLEPLISRRCPGAKARETLLR